MLSEHFITELHPQPLKNVKIATSRPSRALSVEWWSMNRDKAQEIKDKPPNLRKANIRELIPCRGKRGIQQQQLKPWRSTGKISKMLYVVAI